MKVQWGLRAASEHPERIYQRVRLNGRWHHLFLGLPPKPRKPSRYAGLRFFRDAFTDGSAHCYIDKRLRRLALLLA